MRRVIISAGGVTAGAVLNDSKTATAVWDALPITARASTWGDEIYFDVGVAIAPESPKETVALGDLGYWPPGSAFCIFFGPTPASQSPSEIRPASPVNVFGKVDGDATIFKKIRSGESVTIEKA